MGDSIVSMNRACLAFRGIRAHRRDDRRWRLIHCISHAATRLPWAPRWELVKIVDLIYFFLPCLRPLHFIRRLEGTTELVKSRQHFLILAHNS